MTFELQLIDEDSIEGIRDLVGSQWNAYGGKWAIDRHTSDYLYFAGRDVLDPTIPSSFVLRTNNRQDSWHVEVLSARYVPDEYLAFLAPSGTPDRDCVAVLKSFSTYSVHTEPPHETASQALRVLEQKQELNVIFVPDWTALNKLREKFAAQRSYKPPAPRFPAAFALGQQFGRFLRGKK